MTTTVLHGDCLQLIATMVDASVDSIVTDPPYEIGFMGKGWDGTGIANSVALWAECLRVLKPGGHLLAFGGARTSHRMTSAIDDAGFEIRDSIMWVYGSGFPKSLDVSKAIDKASGHWRGKEGDEISSSMSLENPHYKSTPKGHPLTPDAVRWDGWGTAMKPAHEPITVARKPFVGTVANNVLEHGTGAINIGGCRIGGDSITINNFDNGGQPFGGAVGGPYTSKVSHGRWPANVIFDEAAGDELDRQAGLEASRFFYCPKAGKNERNDGLDHLPARFAPTMVDGIGQVEHNAETATPKRNTHPTVKPLALMRYLVRLVTPPGGTVLDPFAGSGTTLAAAVLEGFDAIGCELTDEYLTIIAGRVAWAEHQQQPLGDAI